MISDRTTKIGIIKLVMQRAWRMAKDFEVDFLAPNTFLFSFKFEEDRNKVWLKRPWTVNGSHLLLKEWNSKKALNDIDFTRSTFWVRVQGLPLQYMNEEDIRRIGKLIGPVNEVQADIKVNHIGTRFMRFIVEVDVTKPILVGFFYKNICRGKMDAV